MASCSKDELPDQETDDDSRFKRSAVNDNEVEEIKRIESG